MELDRIEKLLSKYFEATTTVAEERELKKFFAREDLPPQLEQYRPMFGYLTAASKERFTGKVPLKTRKLYTRWLSVAAVALLFIGIYFGKDYQEQQQAEYAYQQTKNALRLLSANLERGTEKVAYLHEFEEAKQKIYNNP